MTRLPRPHRRALPAAALSAAVALVLTLAAPAGAGTYTVWSCRDADGGALPAAAWQGAGVADTCATGGALRAQVDEAGTTGAVFLAPPGTRITGYRASLTAATRDAPSYLADAEAGLAEGGPLGTPPVGAGCTTVGCTFGDELDPLGPAGRVERDLTPGVGALSLVATCVGHLGWGCGPADDDHHGVPAVARLWRSAVDLADEEPPAIGAPAGSLLAGPATGRATLRAHVSDAGGGVAEVELLVDGSSAGSVRPGGACAEPYTAPAPCPAELPASFELDTATLAPGAHTAVLRARDASGAETSTAPSAFTVAAPTAPAASGVDAVVVPSSPVALLSASVAVEQRRVNPGGSVRGTVRLAGGGPAAGAHLIVAARRFGPGDPPEHVVGTAATGADGSFSVPAGLTARALVVRLEDPAYRPAQSLPVRVAGTLRILARPSRRRLTNGQELTLNLRILGAGPGAAALRTVLIQAKVGGRWSTVDSVESRADGKAAWHYRFRRTTRPAIYLFRLRIPAGGEDWPFPTTVSRVLPVAVKP